MNDQDIIRKAVELADGWIGLGNKFRSPMGRYGWYDDVEQETQEALDSLAAQLVRQVDALEWFDFSSDENGSAWVQKSAGISRDPTVSHTRDRTMNTLRAIVESKVLENESND